MNTNTSPHALSSFRHGLYQHVLARRKDALLDLLEAVAASADPQTLVRLSLSPLFPRGWSSACDALSDGTLAPDRLRSLLVPLLPPVADGQRPVWAVDGCVWPRPDAPTCPERTYGHYAGRGLPKSRVIPAWEYQWLGAIPHRSGSWFLPLDVVRRHPTAESVTDLALSQIRRVLAYAPADYPRPVITFDSNYEAVTLARAVAGSSDHPPLRADFIVRLRRNRRFFLAPVPHDGPGRPRLHGPPLRLNDPTTQTAPTHHVVVSDPTYGTVRIDVWTNVHDAKAAHLPFSVVRVQVEHSPRAHASPDPLWLAWISPNAPPDWLQVWRWYQCRFTCEHAFRFAKHDLGWTTVRPRSPTAADRWTWLIVAVFWELWLARFLVTDQRLPWERPSPQGKQSPGRVRRAMGAILASLDQLSRPVQPRGKSPGRAKGSCPGHRPRYPVVKRRR